MEWNNDPHTNHWRKPGWKSPWHPYSTRRKFKSQSVCYQCNKWNFEGGPVSRFWGFRRGLWGGWSWQQARILPSHQEQLVRCPLRQVVNHPALGKVHYPLLLSSSCMEGTWKLEFTSGTQKQFRYWSSDFKYRCKKPSINILPNRNDADVLGIRNGCTFTGWTGSGYDGETFTATAGPGPRDR